MRIVIINRSEPLEQMISYIVERGVDIEIVGEAADIPESGQIIAQEHPEWLFLLAESREDMLDQLRQARAGHTGMHVAALHEGGDEVRILRGAKPGEDATLVPDTWDHMSMSDFVASLTKNASANGDAPRLTESDEHRA